MCSIGTCFLVGCKLWKQHFANATLLAQVEHDDLVMSQNAKLPAPLIGESPKVPDDQIDSLAYFDGSPADAFNALMDRIEAQKEHNFMPLPQLLANHVKLYDDSAIFPKGMTIENAFDVLFSAQSCFFKRFHDQRCDQDLMLQPPLPLVAEGAPWGAIASVSCKVPVPLLGLCKYEDAKRFVLCREEGHMTLAVQQVGKIRAGRFGEFPTEVLYLVTQANNDDVVHMKVLAVIPEGRFASKALQGYQKSMEDFCSVAAGVLQDWRKLCMTAEHEERDHSDEGDLNSNMAGRENDNPSDEAFSLLNYQIY